MPNLKTSLKYKQLRHEQIKAKLKEYQKQYKKQRKEELNISQKLLMRSRLAKFKNNVATVKETRTHRRKNAERVQRYNAQQNSEELNEKRKVARKQWSKCVENFEKEIRLFHSHTCNCCGKLYRYSQLRLLNQKSLKDSGYGNDFIDKIFWVQKTKESKFCTSCAKEINKKKIPRLALCNGLDFPKVDSAITKLNRIEERLLAPRHVFQTLWTVKGPTGQFKTKGGIVNVPVEMDNTVNYLPRPLHDSNMIHVRLARRMEYLKDYMSGIVRTKLLYDAAKKFVQTPLAIEENIKLSANWNYEEDENCNYIDMEDEFYTTNGIHETLLVQNEEDFGFTGLSNSGIRIAPAQGFKPTSILFDDKCEYLAFPKVFGGYKMSPMHYGKEISYADFAKSMVLRYDRRVAERGDLLLFIAKKLELIKLYSNIGICLRKKTAQSNNITAGNMLNNSYVDGLVNHNEGYKILKGTRNSPAHWQNEKTKLLAQIRQFGLPTLFLTLSSADIQWPELLVALKKTVDNESITEEEASKLSYQQRARLVQQDPITCAMHFDERFKALKRTWDSPDGPFLHHKVEHFYHRIEFQQRGSPHIHMLIWLSGSPQYSSSNSSSKKEVCSFIDSIISCSSDELPEELAILQTHKHSNTCRKNNNKKICRFGIPYFPMKSTKILSPLPEDFSEKTLRKLRKILNDVKVLQNKSKTLTYSFTKFLMKLQVCERDYLLAIRSTLTKPQVFLKRSPKDMFISPFSKKIITLMRSNQNLQFVLDAFGAACYIIDYINKTDRGMSNIMKQILTEIREGNVSLHKALMKISTTFHNNSELSIQEACYNILQLHLSESSERCVFIPTFPPHERVRIVKSTKDLEQLEDDSTDVFQDGLIQHYTKRPYELNDVTLAEFAAYYRFGRSPGNQALQLLDKSGYIYKRTRPLIIRFRNYHYETDPDNYLREHIMLYVPWRNEENDILKKNQELIFTRNEKSIKIIKQKFCAFDDKTISVALEEAMNRSEEGLEDSSEEHEGEITSESFCPPSKFDFESYKLDDEVNITRETSSSESQTTHKKFTSPMKMDDSEFQKLFEMLNQDQRDYVMHVADHFESSNEQIFHFLTGGAGVGKSLVIKTLYQVLFRIFNREAESNPDQPKILLCAPTGKAAFNIHGQTLHSAFKLQPNKNKLDELSANVSNTLACALHYLQLIVIDEISMVGQQILGMVSQRLQHLKGNKLPFGGVSVIAVGDFFQLNPVFGRSLINKELQNPYDEIFNKNLWTSFKVFQLTKIMRQNEVEFQNALKHLATGQLTSNDMRLFLSRTFHQLPENLENAIHLFAKNSDVDKFNEEALKRINSTEFICKASDILQGHGSDLAKRQLLYSVANSKIQDTVGIPSTIRLKKGAKYMITYNINTEDGLCNGATGVLKKIDFGTNSKGDQKPLRLWFKFDEKHVGLQIREKHKDLMKKLQISPRYTPLYPVIVTVKTRKNCSLKVNRMQFPLTLAHALTIHKSQGQTMKKVVVHISNRMSRQLLYVACSRATSSEGLSIIGNFRPTQPLLDTDHISQEMKRWKNHALIPKFKFLHLSEENFVMYHNVQSLPKHHLLISNDFNFTSSAIIFLGEIWMSSVDKIKIPNFKILEIIDSKSSRKAYGVCAYIRRDVFHKITDSGAFTLKEFKGRIDSVWIKINSHIYFAIYANPLTPHTLWMKWFSKVACMSSSLKTVIMGDFNINAMKVKSHLEKLLQKNKFEIKNKHDATTHNNTCLDWIVANYDVTYGKYASFFSYHHPIWTKMACIYTIL